jgi:hypothetical protein
VDRSLDGRSGNVTLLQRIERKACKTRPFTIISYKSWPATVRILTIEEQVYGSSPLRGHIRG